MEFEIVVVCFNDVINYGFKCFFYIGDEDVKMESYVKCWVNYDMVKKMDKNYVIRILGSWLYSV